MAYIKTNYVDGVYYPSASSFNNTENGIELCTNKEISVDKNIGDLDDLLISYDNIVEAINSKLTAVSLLSISISSPPLKTNYYLNENLELSGLMMSLNWNNGEKELVPFTKMKRRGLTIFPENGTELTEENTPILIRYPKYEMQVEQEITFLEVTLSSISINTPPIKTTYLVGDVLQLDGLIMSMNYNDGTKKLISLIDFAENNISINPINGSVLTKNNVTVIFSCDGKTTSQALKILYITSMTIKTNPTKMSYFVGENLNLAGLIVNLNRNDGSVTEVPYNNFSSNDITTNPLNNSILNSNANIIITLNNGLESVSTNFNVTIVQISLSSIAIKTPPAKTTYYVGDALNLSGLVVTLNYNNSTKKDVGLIDFGANGITTTPVNGTILIKSYTNITISCSGRSTSQIIVINDVLASSIAIKTPPTKTTYYVGDALNLSGVILTATYDNGTTKDIPFTSFGTSGVTTNPTNGTSLNINHTSAVFSLNGKTVSQSIFVEVVALTGIVIKTQPTKVSYYVGDALNLSGLVVTLNYNNSTKKDVGLIDFGINNIITNPVNGTILNVNNTSVTISKDGKNVSQNIAVTIDSSWTAIKAPEDNEWTSICYGNGLFVAVAYSGTNQIMTSPDGITWTVRKAPGASDWTSICYGNGLFVAVADYGTNRIMTSPDGINWTARKAPEDNTWYSVCYGNGLFVAVAYSGTNIIMTSQDGINWTARKAPEDNGWNSVCYGNGLFVAVASSGTNRIMTSPDGINWTARKTPEVIFWKSVCYGNRLFVAVASSGTNIIMTSPDGINWTARKAPESNLWYSVCYGNRLFVAVAYSGTNRIMTSQDGINWTARKAPEDNTWYSVCYGNGLFVAVASSGTNRIMISEIISLESHLGEISEIKSPSDSSRQSIYYGNNL